MAFASMPSLLDPHNMDLLRPGTKKCCASSCIASEPTLVDIQTPTVRQSSSLTNSSRSCSSGSLTLANEPLLGGAGDKEGRLQSPCSLMGLECRLCAHKTPGNDCSVMSLDSGKSKQIIPLALADSCGSLLSHNTTSAVTSVPLISKRTSGSWKDVNSEDNLVAQPGSSTQGPYSRLNESSGLMCRICHSGSEEEELIAPCRCMGTVKYAHQSCILNWISKSGHPNCELCKYKFKTTRMKIKSCWKWSFPHVSTKGWLHIGLFVAFATMLLTSVTWIVWSRASDAPTALAERTTEEVKFAYMLNGLFIALAIGGLYFDSYKHFRRYSKRWAVMNQHMVVECYIGEAKADEPQTVFELNCVSREAARRDSVLSLAAEISEPDRHCSGGGKDDVPGTWV